MTLTKRQKIVQGVTMVCLVFAGGFVGWIAGYQEGSGTMPFGPSGESIIPPGIEQTSAAEVVEFVEADETNLIEYGVGFNCVEYAFLMAGNARWEGIPAVVVRMDFEDEEINHLILGFPTEDENWKFLDPQGDVWVKPRVGGMFLDKKITGLFYLSDFVWTPLVEIKREPTIEDSAPITRFPEFGSTKEFRFSQGSNEIYTLKEQFKYEDDRGLEGLRKPTYDEAVQLLSRYEPDGVSCSEFSLEAREFANQRGFRCAVVALFFGDESVSGTHAIIAFETSDKGLVHFEPQSNEERRVDFRGQLYPYEYPTATDKLLYVVYIW